MSTDESAWTLPQLCQIFSARLLQPLDYYPDLINQFFVSRNSEAAQLLSRIEQIVLRGGNVLVVGDRGVGKSSFLKWFLERSRFASTIGDHHCHIIDMKRHPGSLEREALLSSVQHEIVEATVEYLSLCHNHPCHEIPELLQAGKVAYAFRKTGNLINQLASIPRKLLLFIDDIDYVDHSHFHEMLARLKPFLSSHNACVILAARRPAANALTSHRDSTIAQFFEPHSRLLLSHLQVHSVLSARIELFGASPALGDILISAQSKLIEFCHDIASLITTDATFASRRIQGLPFTHHQMSFIQETSNGNVKSMLTLSRLFLAFMAQNLSSLDRDTSGHFVIGRERLVAEMGEDKNGQNEKYGPLRIVNLHKRKSLGYLTKAAIRRENVLPDLIGNSLYVCILESIMECESTNETQRRLMRDVYGFIDLEIDEGIEELIEMGMIEEKRLIEIRSTTSQSTPGKDFELTRRGRYYMEWLIHWDCYIEKYGVSHHHKLGVSVSQKSMVTRALQEFVIAICISWPFIVDDIYSRDRFRVNKTTFCESFGRIAAPLLRRANRTDRVKSLVVASDYIEELLCAWKMVSVYGIDVNRCFAFSVTGVKQFAVANNIDWETSYVFDEDEILEFAAERCRVVEGN